MTSEAGTSIADSLYADGLSKLGFQEARNCSICNGSLGKRYMNPRHHCRICGNSVCATCSPNSVQLEGQDRPQRACTACTSVIPIAHQVKDRLSYIVGQLHALAGSDSPLEPPVGILEAVEACESELTLLEEVRDTAEATKTRLRTLEQKLAEAPELDVVKEKEARHTVESQLKDAQEQIVALTARAEQAEAQATSERQQRELLEGRSAQQEESLKAQLAEARAKVREAEAEARAASERADEAEVCAEHNSTIVSDLSTRMEQAEAQATHERVQRQSVEARLAEQETASESQEREAEAKAAKSSSQVATLSDRAEKAEAQIADEREQRQSLESRLVEQESAFKEQVREAEARAEKCNCEIAALTKRAEEAEKQATDERQQRQPLEARLVEQETASNARAREAEAMAANSSSQIATLTDRAEKAELQAAEERERRQSLEVRLAEQETTLQAGAKPAEDVVEKRNGKIAMVTDPSAKVAMVTDCSAKLETHAADERRHRESPEVRSGVEQGADRKTQEHANCSICRSVLSKRLQNPRHICKICGSSVCAVCSPSSVQLEGQQGPQRACNMCVNIIPTARKFKDQLSALAGQQQADVLSPVESQKSAEIHSEQVTHDIEILEARAVKAEVEAKHRLEELTATEARAVKAEVEAQHRLEELAATEEALIAAKARLQELEAHGPEGERCKDSSAAIEGECANADGLDEAGENKNGFLDVSNCTICKNVFGEQTKNPRYLCRLCGSSVCACCSRSRLQLEGQEGPQRACNMCVDMVSTAHKVKGRLNVIIAQLQSLDTDDLPVEPPDGIGEAIRGCEAELIMLEDIREELQRTNGQLASELLQLKADIAKEMLLKTHTRKPSEVDEEGRKLMEEAKARAQQAEASRLSFFFCGRSR